MSFKTQRFILRATCLALLSCGPSSISDDATDGHSELNSTLVATCLPVREVCDGLDNNCNGVADEGLSGCDICADTYHELPVVTNWNTSLNAYSKFGTGQASVFMPYPTDNYVPGACYPYYTEGRIPDLDRYVGDTWSTTSIPDTEARKVFRDICRATGIPVRFLRSDALGTPRLRSAAGAVQVVHANLVDGSLVTVVLPANWQSGSATRYPIVANGFYDLNDNLFRLEGPDLVRMIALSSTQGRTGAIGVLWNGGGAQASRTMNQKALTQFAHIIDFVALNFSGDRHRLLMYGDSRGGYTTLVMASNPKNFDYRVTFAALVVPVVRAGEHSLLASTTFPGILEGESWSIGFHDAWRTGWKYPACAGKPHLTGRSASEAHLYVLTGTTDAAFADANYSPISPVYLAGLKAAGTKVYLQLSSHDYVIPYAHEVEYGSKLIAAGIPVEADVLIRAGHAGRTETDKTFGPAKTNRIWAALQFDIDPKKVGKPVPFVPGIRYFRVNRSTLGLEAFTPVDGKFPFTLEAPRYLARGQRFPLVLVGEKATRWEVTLTLPGGTPFLWSGTIGEEMKSVQWVDLLTTTPLGDYTYGLRIQKPGTTKWVTIPQTNTIDGSAASFTLVDVEPNLGGSQLRALIQAPTVGSFTGTSWGLSEY